MFPFFNNYPGTDLHEIDLAYILKVCAELRASNTTLEAWKSQHEAEYEELNNKVEGLINNLVDVISPWDSSIAYHVYSIVEYLGTNYIAIQDVPVGAMITNTDYWQPANTALEQINAMGVVTSEIQNGLEELEAKYEADRYWYYPEDFGAVGDGVTDDAAAFQNMFDTVPESSLIILKAAEYFIGSNVTCNKGFLRITGVLNSEYTPKIIMGYSDGICITFTRSGVHLSNFAVTRNTETRTGTLLYFNADNDVAAGNIDAVLKSMTLYYSYTAILCRGRNVQVNDCLISTSERGVHLVNTVQDTDNRGYDIRNNRFHYCPIAIYSQVNNSRPLRDGEVSSNFFDGCGELFAGYGDGFSIRNNLFDGKGNTTLYGVINLLVSSSPLLCTIMGNAIQGDATYTNFFVQDQAGCITDVMNNDISNIKSSGITALGAMNIINNIIRNASNNASGAYPVVYGASGSGHCYGNLRVDCDKGIIKASGSAAVIVNNYPA